MLSPGVSSLASSTVLFFFFLPKADPVALSATMYQRQSSLACPIFSRQSLISLSTEFNFKGHH